MTRPQARSCPRWCDFADQGGHSGNHVAHIGEIMLPRNAAVFAVAVTAESDSQRPYCVLTLAARQFSPYNRAILSWDMAERLAGLLLHGKRSYAS
ncbi:hypothetical protein EF847_15200 [Actinobacteria bacterium YIM 96077]|uniref:Uncharacterized protein n=1 Tax=Phytoactinopolyspora halophila TaxID=1981511 RepID=A0A329QU79_9ACTN|nr:hypothetical protein [Phytoactinopolyspora halophila]AYY13845.1 hypothetical protein EF847_15200 [Actinobacteria bacterium YIM 96077]RAW15611.1 hypothetical protein DPM12_08140 [Phytoactinopolyspora halophila]